MENTTERLQVEDPMAQPSALSSRPTTHEWSWRMPSPPRLFVPAVETKEWRMVPDPSGLPPNGFANSEFLKMVALYVPRFDPMNILDWKYEHRRVAQAVMPFLHLGPVTAARDAAYLTSQGITMVIAVRNTLTAEARLLNPKVPRELGLECLNIDVSGNQQLIAVFPKVIDAINMHLSARFQERQKINDGLKRRDGQPVYSLPGKVLVYCESGNERSAAVVAAYVLAMFSVDVVQAIHFVQAQRFCTSYDDDMRQLLLNYEAILKAQREVARARIHAEEASGSYQEKPQSTLLRVKRSLYEACNDDVEMQDGDIEMDTERFQKREGLAPFLDVPALGC